MHPPRGFTFIRMRERFVEVASYKLLQQFYLLQRTCVKSDWCHSKS